MARLPRFSFFKAREGYGAIFIRVLIGAFIIWGVQDNILSFEQMEEFAHFLAVRGVPLPLFAAIVSVYVQMICGLSILFGAAVRATSIPLIVNFVAALGIAHRGDSFRGMFPALMMIAAGLFFLFHGAGELSVDEYLQRPRRR
jgi:putative oxidoreductase